MPDTSKVVENDHVREKLIEFIRCAGFHPCKGAVATIGSRFTTEFIEDIADNLIANGVTVQEWIPVTERPPEVASKHKRYKHSYTKSIRVLCACVQKDGKKMVKEGYCEFWDDYPEPIWKIPGTIDSVTHWAYLPEPPKGD